jgi:hypothetical protein
MSLGDQPLLTPPVASDTVARNCTDATQLLNVEMNQAAGLVVHKAVRGCRSGPDSHQAEASNRSMNGRRRQLKVRGDAVRTPTAAGSQGRNLKGALL